MKLLVLFAFLVALTVVGRTVLKLRGNRLVERPISTLATVRVPARLNPWDPRTNWLGTHMRLSRFMNSIRAMGSSTPTHEDLLITQLEPKQMARLGEQVVRHLHGAFEHVEEVAWEPWSSRGAASIRVGTARYTPNGLNDPAWVVQVLDREHGLVVGYRGLQKHLSREAAIALVDSALASYRLVTEVATWFSSVERDLGGGMFISLPVELYDPYMLETASSGLRWMLFRHHPEGAENRELMERALAVAAFFAPGNAAQESEARAILAGEVLREATVTVEAETDANGLEVSLVLHAAVTGAQSAWLVTGFDAARGVGVTVRLWQHDASRAEAVNIVTRALASYRFTGDPTWFAPAGGGQ